MNTEISNSNLDKDFYDSSWDKWLDMKKFGPMSRHTRRLCMEIIKKLDFDTILDAGCGEGSLLKFLETNGREAQVFGADISQIAVNNAKKILPKGKFYVVDLQKNFIEEKFDLVTAIDVIEHIENDVEFLKHICKMSRKYFLICTLIGKMRPFEKEVGHVRNYSEKELVDKLNIAGFDCLSIKKWGFPFYSPLYRNVLQYTPQNVSMGEFGLFKKIIAIMLYLIFFLNIPNRGDVILILAKPK